MIKVTENGFVRKVQDDMNPRIFREEFKCANCGDWVDQDEVVWVPDWETGQPYHVECAGDQEDYDE